MIEQKVEKYMVEKFKTILQGLDVKVYGTLQPTEDNAVKGEEGNASGVLSIKVSPREYEGAMLPTIKLNCAVSLAMRADVDYNGKTYLDVMDIVLEELDRYQKCLCDVHDEYELNGEFRPTGFLLGAGATSLDQTNKVWQYTHSFTIYGVMDGRTGE